MIKKSLLLIFLLASSLQALTQELYCTVKVNYQQVEGTETRVFENLERALFEFINNRKWTNYNYGVNERIECTMLITISERTSSDQFKGSINIALKRPIFNSAYNSTTLNYIDRDFQFEYVEFQPLEFQDNVFAANLTSVLAYWVYVFIGIDFDTFVQDGGTPFYEKAESIVNAAQNESYPGWKSFEDQKNRYWLVENMLNPSYEGIRKFLYEYHRKGLDIMYDDAASGRAAILKSLKYLETVQNQRPGLFLLQLIMEAKSDELVNIFSEGSPAEKTQAVNILKKIDPANISKYDEIMKN
ncbi:MAG: DUF4835 family protein [Bacteroidetes bacterium]|nr:DUF4835 family protein [Bacteroidota bacterium]